MGWLAERSGRRIDLDRVWSEQRLPPGLVKALETVCATAHEHIIGSEGNPGEISKRETCWNAFRDREIEVPAAWEREWADHAFVAPTTDEEALAAEWEKVRWAFLDDGRTIEGLEAYTNRAWVPRYRRETVSSFASMDWAALRLKPGLGLKKLRGLVEMLAVGARDTVS